VPLVAGPACLETFLEGADGVLYLVNSKKTPQKFTLPYVRYPSPLIKTQGLVF